MSLGGTQTPQTQQTTTVLSPEQRALMQLALPGVMQFAATTPQRYQGSTISGFDPAQQQAQEMALRTATGMSGAGGASGLQFTGGTPSFNESTGQYITAPGGGAPAPTQQGVANTSADALIGMLGGGPERTQVAGMNLPGQVANPFQGDFWNPANNPVLQGAITSATRPITQQLTESILPNLRSEAQLAGPYGGSRQGIAEGLAAGRASQAVGDTAANLAQSTYGTNIGAMLGARGQDVTARGQDVGAEVSRYGTDVGAAGAADRLRSENISRALGLSPTISDQLLTPARTVGGVGDVRQALTQALLGEKVGQFNYDQLAPFLQSKEIMSLLTGLPGGSTISQASIPRVNPLLAGLGGAASGAAIGSAFGPVGTGIGGAGGALLGLLGSRRA